MVWIRACSSGTIRSAQAQNREQRALAAVPLGYAADQQSGQCNDATGPVHRPASASTAEAVSVPVSRLMYGLADTGPVEPVPGVGKKN